MKKNLLIALLMMAGTVAQAAGNDVLQRLQQRSSNGAATHLPMIHNSKVKQPTVLTAPGATTAFKAWNAMPTTPSG